MLAPGTAFTPPQRADLLAIARRAIRERVRGLPLSNVTPEDSGLRAPGAAFVTLTRAGALRGCIGYVHAIQPLAEAVGHAAASAATGDPRFPSVTAAELTEIGIEISVLSPLHRVTDAVEVRVGIHGLHISQDDRRGLLLPQVATEYGWDREMFLRQTCIKAGLPPDAWRHGAELQVFTVEHITDGLPVGTGDA